MKQELEQKIVEIAPYMFRYDGWNNLQQSLMGFGFECGDGWYSLLKRLVIDLSAIDHKKELHVSQVKEKFGTLSFYINHGSNKIFDRIDKAERESAKTCEECGKPGKVRGIGWIYTRCDDCWNKINEDRGYKDE